jgi:predicted enzyme related to lactoylglutathione lyase
VIQTIKLSVYPVKDLARAKALYTTLLGVAPYADSPYYVGFKIGDHEVGLDPNAHRKGITGPLEYWQVADIKHAVNAFVEAGATLQDDVKDVGGGMLIATIKDADGNLIGIRQA